MSDASANPPGLEMFEKIMGRPYTKPLTGLREITINHLFADIWTRPHLSHRDRSLITIALLAAQGRPEQLRAHIAGARSRGLTEDEILEIMVQVAHYAGWAAGTSGQLVAESVFAEEASGT